MSVLVPIASVGSVLGGMFLIGLTLTFLFAWFEPIQMVGIFLVVLSILLFFVLGVFFNVEIVDSTY